MRSIFNGNKQSIVSIIIDFLMNHSVHWMRLKEKLKLQKLIDIEDDKRRQELRKNEALYIKKFRIAIREKDLIKMEKLVNEFEIFKKKEYSKEDHLESLDDEITTTNITEVKKALNNNLEETEAYQKEMINNRNLNLSMEVQL